MPINSGLPTSRRGYLSQDELKQFANIVINDATEADDVIGQAEELIDAFIRRADKFLPYPINGQASGGSTTTLIDASPDSQLTPDSEYFKNCEIEILAGANAGQRHRILSYDKTAQTLTVANAFTVAIDATSVYEIYQLGLFPRIKDVWHNNGVYYKRIPEAIKRAVAAQVEFIIEKGDSFFAGAADFQSESIDDYSYNRGPEISGIKAMIAPKARMFLRGFVSRIGVMEAPNPTDL